MKLPSLKPQEWSGQTYAWVGSGLFRIGVYPALKWTNYFGIQISRWKCTCFILIWLLAILWKYQVIWIDLNHAPLYDPSTYNFTHIYINPINHQGLIQKLIGIWTRKSCSKPTWCFSWVLLAHSWVEKLRIVGGENRWFPKQKRGAPHKGEILVESGKKSIEKWYFKKSILVI